MASSVCYVEFSCAMLGFSETEKLPRSIADIQQNFRDKSEGHPCHVLATISRLGSSPSIESQKREECPSMSPKQIKLQGL